MSVKGLLKSLCFEPEKNRTVLELLLNLPEKKKAENRNENDNELIADFEKHVAGRNPKFWRFVYNNLYGDCLSSVENSKAVKKLLETLDKRSSEFRDFFDRFMDAAMLNRIGDAREEAKERANNLRKTTSAILGKGALVHGA